MFKKIFYGLLVAAMLGGMTSCSSSPVGNEDDIIVPEDTASVGTVRFNLAGIDDGKTRAPQAIDFKAYKVEMLVYKYNEPLLGSSYYTYEKRIGVTSSSFEYTFSKGTYKFIFLAYTNNKEDGKQKPENNFVGNLSTGGGGWGSEPTKLSEHISLTNDFIVASELFQAQTDDDITVEGEGILGGQPEEITIPQVIVTLTRISGAVKFSLAAGSLVGQVNDGEQLTFSATIRNAPNMLVLVTSGNNNEKKVTTSGGKTITLEKQFTYQKDSPAQFILNTLPFETAQNADFSFEIKKGDQKLVSKSIEAGLLYVNPNTYTLLEYDGKSLNMSIELEDGVWDGPNP